MKELTFLKQYSIGICDTEISYLFRAALDLAEVDYKLFPNQSGIFFLLDSPFPELVFLNIEEFDSLGFYQQIGNRLYVEKNKPSQFCWAIKHNSPLLTKKEMSKKEKFLRSLIFIEKNQNSFFREWKESHAEKQISNNKIPIIHHSVIHGSGNLNHDTIKEQSTSFILNSLLIEKKTSFLDTINLFENASIQELGLAVSQISYGCEKSSAVSRISATEQYLIEFEQFKSFVKEISLKNISNTVLLSSQMIADLIKEDNVELKQIIEIFQETKNCKWGIFEEFINISHVDWFIFWQKIHAAKITSFAEITYSANAFKNVSNIFKLKSIQDGFNSVLIKFNPAFSFEDYLKMISITKLSLDKKIKIRCEGKNLGPELVKATVEYGACPQNICF